MFFMSTSTECYSYNTNIWVIFEDCSFVLNVFCGYFVLPNGANCQVIDIIAIFEAIFLSKFGI